MDPMKEFELHLIPMTPDSNPPQLGDESGVRRGRNFAVTAESLPAAIEKVAARPEVGSEGFACDSITERPCK